MENYCIYLRKSRADYEAEQRGEGETLQRHKNILQALAIRNHHVIGQVYQEIVSGETIADRPQMRALLSAVTEGKWTGVYVMEVERLARGDTMDQGLVAHSFKAIGTRIITPTKSYNPADPADEEYFEFALFMSRREYKTINRRMQGGRVQSVREGKYMGSRAPYGYRKTKIMNDKGFTLAIHEEEAQVVRQIFEWYANGIDGKVSGLVRISARLDDLHTPTGDQGSVWKPCRIHRILQNPVYIGMIQWGKDKTIRTVTASGIQKKRVMQAQGERYRGLHAPIIDDCLFDQVQQKLHSKQGHVPVRKGSQLSNPLAGIVYCAHCHHLMGGIPQSGRQGARLKCRTHGCPTVQNYLDPVVDSILNTLKTWLPDEKGLPIFPPAMTDTQDDALLRQSLQSMQEERAKLLKQIARLQDLVEQEVYSIDQYNDRYATLQERMQTLIRDQTAIEKERQERPVYCSPEMLAPDIVRLLREYDTATAEQKNAMLKACVSRIIYRKTKKGIVRRGVVHADANQFELDIYPKLMI